MSEKLSPVQRWVYVLPELITSCLVASTLVLQGIYAKYFGLELASIAWVLFISRVFDAVSDPLIGYCADRYYARHGSRKPFVLAGSVLLVISSGFLFVPPASVSVTYFLLWFLVFYLAYTLFTIPHMAWAGCIATDSIAKNRLFGLRTLATLAGALLFSAIPLLPLMDSSAFTPQSLKWTAIIGGGLLLPAVCLCLWLVPNGHASLQQRSPQPIADSPQQLIQSVWGNKPFLLLIISMTIIGLGIGSYSALLFFFVDGYLGLGEQFSLLYALAYGGSLFAVGPWVKLANRYGKAIAWSISLVLGSGGILSFLWLSPETTGALGFLFSALVLFAGVVATQALAFAWLSEIADYGTWKFGHDRSGTYFSVALFINKSAGALGAAFGLAVLSGFGFDATATSHSDQAILGLRVGVAVLPALTFLLAIYFIARIPIDAHRHGVIQRRLTARAERLSAPPITASP